MSSATAPGRRAAAIAGVVVALALGLAWPNLHPAGPLLPTDDLYSHLSVARHLVRGDGFLCDVTYPCPSPGRGPAPFPNRWRTARRPGRSCWRCRTRWPARTRPRWSRRLACCSVGCWRWRRAGHRGLIRRGRPGAAAAWVVALTACPLLPYVVDWGTPNCRRPCCSWAAGCGIGRAHSRPVRWTAPSRRLWRCCARNWPGCPWPGGHG